MCQQNAVQRAGDVRGNVVKITRRVFCICGLILEINERDFGSITNMMDCLSEDF